MRRGRPVFISTNPPPEERVDRAGIRQREDKDAARASRQLGRQDSDERGWWWHDGAGNWWWYGEEDPPEDA